MYKQVFQDEWSCHTAGGCGNFDTFSVNPAYMLNVHQGMSIFFRLMQTSQTAMDGSVVTEP